jgi:glutathione synthase/RimK-type ligase-like ATP-grasp enzyme
MKCAYLEKRPITITVMITDLSGHVQLLEMDQAEGLGLVPLARCAGVDVVTDDGAIVLEVEVSAQAL